MNEEYQAVAAQLEQLDARICAMARYYAPGREEDAEDLAQEGRAAAWVALRGYTPGRVPATAYALVAARFACLDWLRKEGRPGRRATAELPLEIIGEGATPETLVIAVRAMVDRLGTLRERDQIVLRAAFAGWSAQDLAPVLNLSADRVRQVRLDALRALAS